VRVSSNLLLTRVEHPIPPIMEDTDQPKSMPPPEAKPFRVLISSDTKVSLMSLHVFLTLQIPISSLTPMPPFRGPSGDVMETHGSVMLPVALGATDDF
jgi:hypothetical protein